MGNERPKFRSELRSEIAIYILSGQKRVEAVKEYVFAENVYI